MIPRGLQNLLIEKIKYSPVILIHGPRQCGKTTLAELVGKSQGYSYFTMDDPDTRNHAQSDPKGFVGNIQTPMIMMKFRWLQNFFESLK